MAAPTGQSIGRYQILSRSGEESMAAVYKARDTCLDRDVDLKLIRLIAFPAEMHGHILARYENRVANFPALITLAFIFLFSDFAFRF